MRLAVGTFLILALAGCQSTGTGARWFAPATWFAHAPADTLDKAEKKEDAARHAAIKSAQRATHETAFALAAAPTSRPVAAATDSNSQAVALLDQAAGPLEAGDLAKLRNTVAGLLSENADVRAAAEKQRNKDRESIVEVSGRLAKAEQRSDAAGAELRRAFDRENALANELRSQRALFWIACGVAALLAIGWLYVRFALGGVPGAVGRGLASLRASNPAAADLVTAAFDSYLNRHEQERIAKAARL
jgi:hypothetical protein